MTRTHQKPSAHPRATTFAEGLATVIILSTITLFTIATAAIIAIEWQGVKLFLFGG